MRAVDIIQQKRRGETHSPAEINFLIQNYVHGAIPDYQMSAWLMAVLWRGLSEPETFALTAAMIASGDTLDLSSLPGPCVDKHSTGGVGDKTTLAVVPILASAGVQVPKMSGRGLGHTGGTLDKLEALGGTRTEMETAAILAQVQTVGACIILGSAMAVSIVLALLAIRRRDFVAHGAWMIRGYAIGLGAGTQVLTHLPWFMFADSKPGEFPRALMMGAGWGMNVMLAEWIIRRARTRERAVGAGVAPVQLPAIA